MNSEYRNGERIHHLSRFGSDGASLAMAHGATGEQYLINTINAAFAMQQYYEQQPVPQAVQQTGSVAVAERYGSAVDTVGQLGHQVTNGTVERPLEPVTPQAQASIAQRVADALSPVMLDAEQIVQAEADRLGLGSNLSQEPVNE